MNDWDAAIEQLWNDWDAATENLRVARSLLDEAEESLRVQRAAYVAALAAEKRAVENYEPWTQY
jgi:hypothetical protein